jgi:hypothetical protein
MKDGRISEQGSYQQLVDNKGEFQEFLLQHLAQDSEDEPPAGLLFSLLTNIISFKFVMRSG